MFRRRHLALIPLIAIALVALVPALRLRAAAYATRLMDGRAKTVADRLAEFGEAADTRWRERTRAVGIAYPPHAVTLVALKETKRLEVWFHPVSGKARLAHSFPILAASGGPGPKLRQGDRQVPEGVYPIESLNPNSLYHVALRIGYPNTEDLRLAANDGRKKLGGDIMIHGKNCSIGCLAMGDEAAEDLFALAAKVTPARLTVLMCPADFRQNPDYAPPPGAPGWVASRYAELRLRLQEFRPPETSKLQAPQEHQ